MTTATYAADKLRQLARCRVIRPFQAGDEDLVCGNDMIALVSTGRGLAHDPREINRLRAATNDGRWPSEVQR